MRTIDLVTQSRIVIEAPPEKIWPLILNPNDWKQGLKPEHVSGPRDQLGEVRIARQEYEGQVFELKIVTVAQDHLRRKVIKIYTGPDAAPGYAAWQLLEVPHGTLVTYDVYAEMDGSQVPDDQWQSLSEQYVKQNQERFDAELVALKALID